MGKNKLVVLLIALVLPPVCRSQAQASNHNNHAELRSDGTIYVGSDEGKHIKMADPGYCSESIFADDEQTVFCLVMDTPKPGEGWKPLRLEIYLRNGEKRIIDLTTPSRWHLWNGGQEVVVCSQSPPGHRGCALYDSRTTRIVEQIAEPTDEHLLPQWAKNPEQIEDESVPVSENLARARTQWIAKVMREIQKIQPGMKREDLLKVFTDEGGISTRYQRIYVYPECRFIKVDVRFKAGSHKDDGLQEYPDDVIEYISRPYLDWTVAD